MPNRREACALQETGATSSIEGVRRVARCALAGVFIGVLVPHEAVAQAVSEVHGADVERAPVRDASAPELERLPRSHPRDV